MSKNLIKPVENEDFWEARNAKSDILSESWWWGNNPPPFVWMAAEPENVQNPASHIERGGVINNSSDSYVGEDTFTLDKIPYGFSMCSLCISYGFRMDLLSLELLINPPFQCCWPDFEHFRAPRPSKQRGGGLFPHHQDSLRMSDFAFLASQKSSFSSGL